MGLVSDGGVHSLDEHLYAILALAKEMDLTRVFVHMFTDGRDTPERVALQAIAKLKDRINRIGVGSIASIGGRFYTMDRGGHWDQTEMTYQVLANGKGHSAATPEEAVEQNYSQQIFDEMIPPIALLNFDQKPIATVQNNDAVIFFNFRQLYW